MSVDFDELAAHLDRQTRTATKAQYEQRSTHATTAFLLCFFLGYLGAHRFYLGQWRTGLAHLVVFLAGAAAVIAGYFTSKPLDEALYVIGGLVILASLIWEIVDLGRIDNEIHRRNTLLAEGLIAGALLADPAPVEGAMRKLDEVVHTAGAQSRAASMTPAAATPGMISAADLAQARALAEESGSASISYNEVSNFTVSETPEERAGKEQATEPVSTTERTVNPNATVAADEVAPAIETQTHTHSESGYRVTDSDETDHVAGPSAAEVIGLGGAALGAAGLGYAAVEAAHAHDDGATYSPAADEVTAPYTPPPAEPAPDSVETPSSEPVTPAYSAPNEAATPRSGGDVTDAGAPARFEPAADVAYGGSHPSYVSIPGGPETAYGGLAEDTPTADMPLSFTPDAAPTVAPAPEAYIPPAPEVYSAPAEPAQAAAPSWDEPTAPMAEPQPDAGSHVAEVAGLGALAGAGALAADEWAHHGEDAGHPSAAPEAAAETAPAEAAPPAAPKMKRIRVKRRIVVDGQVVREEVVEREIPADADMAAAAREIQQELEQTTQATPEEIARLANLSGDDEVQVSRHVEGLGQE